MSTEAPSPHPAEPPQGEPAPPIEPTKSAPGWGYQQGQSSRTTTLALYLEANRGRFTDEALAGRATEAGYTGEEIDQATELLRSVEAATPVRKRARQVVLAAYLVTYAVLVAGMAVNPSTYGAGTIGIIVLTVVLGTSLAIALALVRRARPRAGAELALAGVLAVPVILLVVVAGLCVGTGLPIPRAYDTGPGPAPIEEEPPPVPAES